MLISMIILVVVFMSFDISTCIKIPSEMKKMMNTDIKPCDDFYEYACGRWLDSITLERTQTYVDPSYRGLMDNNDKHFDAIVRENRPILGELWDSCIADTGTSDIVNQQLKEDLSRIATAKSKTELMTLAGKFSAVGNQGFINYYIGTDHVDGYYTIVLTPPELLLPRPEYYIRDDFVHISTTYKFYIDALFNLSEFSLLKDEPGSNPAENVLQIERVLANYEKIKNANAERWPIKIAKYKWPTLVKPFLSGMGQLKIASVKYIYIMDAEHFTAAENLINKSPLVMLKEYMAVALIQGRSPWLSEKFRRNAFILSNMFRVTPQKYDPRPVFCRKNLMKYVPELFGKYYNEKAFGSKQKDGVSKMIKLIKHAMREHISNSRWLDTETQNQAITKLNKTIELIGQPRDESHQYPKMSRVDYSTNIYSIITHTSNTKLKKVGHKVRRKDWIVPLLKMEATYNWLTNSITLPSVILQPPLFNGSEIHPARNFGAIGTLIGHELTHAFDNVGREYDGKGRKHDWWSTSSANEFIKRAQCMITQYSQYQVMGERGIIGKVNGTLTLNENIADNGGVALAWDAYRKYLKVVQSKSNDKPRKNKRKREEISDVPRKKREISDISSEVGNDIDEGDELFFLAFGQMWCRKGSDDYILDFLSGDPHAPAKWRVNGALKNNRDFARVYKCDDNTPMNPSIKCELW